MNNSFLSKKNPDDIKVDLHLHTTASDGTWRPETLVKNLVDAGIGLFAVTDHDSTENLAETAALAKEHGLGFILGVEVHRSRPELSSSGPEHPGRKPGIAGVASTKP